MANTIIPPNYPNSNRTPVVAFQLDNSNANTSVANLKTLLVGQTLSSGTATAGVPVLVYSQTAANTLFGTASMLAAMYNTYTGDDGFAEIWALPIADSTGAAATFTATVTGPATASGSLSVYIAGQLVSVGVSQGDTANVIAGALATAIRQNPTLPVTTPAPAVPPVSAVLTLTCVHAGPTASGVDLRLNYLGETTPAGVAVTFATGTATTAADPSLTAPLAALADHYAFMISPYSGSAQMAAFQAILNDVNGNWSWLSNTGGGVFSAIIGSYAQIQTYGATNNLQHVSVLGITNTPTPVWRIAASYGAVCANSLRVDPALPLTAVLMNGIQAPPVKDRYTRLMRNTLLYDGIATWTSNRANQMILELAITTYQTGLLGQPDNSYLYVNTLYTLQAIIDRWKTAFSQKYARVKLVDNSTPIRPGTSTVNPSAIRSEVIAQYQSAADDGLVQDVGSFIKGVATQQVSPNQVNVLAPVQIATGLYQLVFDMAFSL